MTSTTAHTGTLAMTDTASLIDAAATELHRLGIVLVGCSSKSASTYWALMSDDGQPRIRLSDHAVAYPSSDCDVCLGVSLDDDVRLDRTASVADAVRRAVVMLVEAQIAYQRSQALNGYEPGEDADLDAEAADGEAWVRKNWGHLLAN